MITAAQRFNARDCFDEIFQQQRNMSALQNLFPALRFSIVRKEIQTKSKNETPFYQNVRT
jgi:hypothetical protein